MSSDEEDPPSYRPFAKKNRWPIPKGVSHCGAASSGSSRCASWPVNVWRIKNGWKEKM